MWCITRKHLQGAAVAEGKSPGLAARVGVDSVEVDGSIFFRLASGQESDSSNCGRDSPLQSSDGGAGDFLWGVLGLAGLAGCDHVGLEKSSFQEDVMVVQSLVHGGQDGLGDLLGPVQVVIAVGKNLLERNER